MGVITKSFSHKLKPQNTTSNYEKSLRSFDLINYSNKSSNVFIITKLTNLNDKIICTLDEPTLKNKQTVLTSLVTIDSLVEKFIHFSKVKEKEYLYTVLDTELNPNNRNLTLTIEIKISIYFFRYRDFGIK